MEGIVTAIKEVNTPNANVGDLISYTTTITNHSDQVLTQLIYKDPIDKSLEVEPNSIGINGMVSRRQILNGLVLPDLAPGQTSRVEFNAYIRRYPGNSALQLNESALFTFQANGISESVQADTAVTSVNKAAFEPMPLNMLLTADKSLTAIGSTICFTLKMIPVFCEAVSHIQLSIQLDPNLCFVMGSLKVNGAYQQSPLEQICLPDLKNMQQKKIRSIEVQFEAIVISLPQIIRALTSTTATAVYEYSSYHLPMITGSNEALVEIAPPMLWHTYQIEIPLFTPLSCQSLQLSEVKIGQVMVNPIMPQQCPLDHMLIYEVLLIYVNEAGETVSYSLQKSLALQYPYTDNTTVYVWLDEQHMSYEEGSIKAEIGVLLQDE